MCRLSCTNSTGSVHSKKTKHTSVHDRCQAPQKDKWTDLSTGGARHLYWHLYLRFFWGFSFPVVNSTNSELVLLPFLTLLFRCAFAFPSFFLPIAVSTPLQVSFAYFSMMKKLKFVFRV